MRLNLAIVASTICLIVCGCKPADAPPDLIKAQREAIDQAKAVEGQLQQSQDRLKAAEEAQK